MRSRGPAGRLADAPGHLGAFWVTVAAAVTAALLAASSQPFFRRLGGLREPESGARVVAGAAT